MFICPTTGKKKKKKESYPPRRGIEPRSPAWQAGILTTILTRSCYGMCFLAFYSGLLLLSSHCTSDAKVLIHKPKQWPTRTDYMKTFSLAEHDITDMCITNIYWTYLRERIILIWQNIQCRKDLHSFLRCIWKKQNYIHLVVFVFCFYLYLIKHIWLNCKYSATAEK